LSWSDEKEVKAWKEKVDDPDNQGKTLPVTPDSFLSLTGNKKRPTIFLRWTEPRSQTAGGRIRSGATLNMFYPESITKIQIRGFKDHNRYHHPGKIE